MEMGIHCSGEQKKKKTCVKSCSSIQCIVEDFFSNFWNAVLFLLVLFSACLLPMTCIFSLRLWVIPGISWVTSQVHMYVCLCEENHNVTNTRALSITMSPQVLHGLFRGVEGPGVIAPVEKVTGVSSAHLYPPALCASFCQSPLTTLVQAAHYVDQWCLRVVCSYFQHYLTSVRLTVFCVYCRAIWLISTEIWVLRAEIGSVCCLSCTTLLYMTRVKSV